jgi:hypothetical protein
VVNDETSMAIDVQTIIHLENAMYSYAYVITYIKLQRNGDVNGFLSYIGNVFGDLNVI